MDGPFPVRDSKCFASVYADLGFDVGICRDARPTFQSAKMAAEKDVHVSAVFSSSLNGNVGRTALLLEALEKENKKGRHIIAYGDPFFQDVRGVVQSRGDGCLFEGYDHCGVSPEHLTSIR